MMDKIPEPDWKVFKRQHLVLHERFVEAELETLRGLFENREMSPISRFEALADAFKKSRKRESDLFDDYRRSTAVLHILKWLDAGLLTEKEFLEYGAEVQDRLNKFLELRGND
jgi:hypothetical protein